MTVTDDVGDDVGKQPEVEAGPDPDHRIVNDVAHHHRYHRVLLHPAVRDAIVIAAEAVVAVAVHIIVEDPDQDQEVDLLIEDDSN